MKKKPMRIISLVLALVMVVSLLPLSAFAETSGRKVGVVVYGSELTAILTSVEKSFKDGAASIENGDADAAVENVKNSLDTLVDLATSFTTGAIDGTGFSVPDLNLEVKDSAGKTYSMTEQTVEIFTQTTVVDLPLQSDLEEILDDIDQDVAELKVILNDWEPIPDTVDVVGINDKIHDLTNKIDAVNFQELTNKLGQIVNDIVGNLAKLTGLEGKLYRSYIVDKPLTVGETYYAYITGFTDTDEDNNPITRDGYIVYNDGLEDGSMFNTTRRFSFEVEKQGRFEHEIQFVGPKAGISGSLDLGEDFAKAYDGVVKGVNTLIDVLKATNSWLTEGYVVSFITGALADLFDARDLMNWFNEKAQTLPSVKTSDEIDKDYEISFPGLWCAEADAGFTFKNVDIAEAGITGSEFLMVNREEVVDVLKFMTELGKDAFNAALKATFGGDVTFADGTTKTYEGITELYTQLVKSEDGQLSLDEQTAYAIIKTYIGIIGDMNLFDRVVVTEGSGLTKTMKLRYPIPAILKAESDENGYVSFNKSSNITLTWMIEIIDSISDTLTSMETDNQVVNLLLTLYNYYEDLTANFAESIINTAIYPFAQRLGLVGKKFASGYYIMFQYKAADGYWRNPLAYTMKVEWINETWAYVTLADLGIIMPYFAEGFYDFVRNTTVAGTIDKFLGKLTGKTDFDLVSKILSDDIDLTAELNQQVTAALTAFAAQIGFEALGGDKLFSSTTDLAADMNQYLYNQGRTAQNLMVYMNNMALKAKEVYAGNLNKVDEDGNQLLDANGNPICWQFYNIDKSPTATLNKVISKTTENIAACFVSDKQKTVVTNTGATVQKVVNAVSTTVETAAKKVTTKVTTAAKSAVSKIASSVGSYFKSSASSLLNKLFSKSAVITFNA